MDVNNNELVSPRLMDELVKKVEGKKLQRLPQGFDHAARLKLAGKDCAFVSKTSGGKLSRWAAAQRKAKRKRQQQRKARRRNR